MQSVVIKDEEWKDGLGVKLFNLQQTGQFCDVIIKTIEDARLLVHSCILAAASPLLKGVIESALNDSSLGTIMLSSDIDLATWNHMLEFMYMGSTSVEVTLLPSLSNGASILKIDTLVDKCSEVIVEKPAEIEEQEPIIEPTPESAETELYPVIAQIKEDSDHGMDTEDYNIDVQEIIAVDLNAKSPSAHKVTLINSSPYAEVTWADSDNLSKKPLIATDEKESPMLSGKDIRIQNRGTHLIDQFYEKNDIVVKGTRFQVLDNIDLKGRSTYKCCVCRLEVSSPITHALVHTDERPYKCEYSGCFKSYKGKEALKRHIGSNHTPGSYGCPKCGKVYKTQHLLQKHIAVVCQNEKGQYVCELCEKTFRTRTSLKYHLGNHSTVKPFFCEICDKKFASTLHLYNHRLTHKSECYKCNCGLQYKNLKSYKEHIKLIHDKTNPIRCPICSRNFKNDKALQNHKKSHLKPFSCKVCKKGFNTASYCFMHEKLRHTHKNSTLTSEWTCPTCAKRCKTYRALYAHIRVHDISDGKKCPTDRDHHTQSHFCEKCCKTFPSQGALRYHEKHHFKLYACKFCGARFSLSGYLKNHQKKCKLLKTESKTFTCSFCQYQFSSEMELQIHITTTHPDEKLISFDCSTETVRNVDLKHVGKCNISNHGGLFNCDVCSYVFQTEKSLLRHELKVHALKSNRQNCSECNVKFTTSRTLNKHIFMEHNIGILKPCPYCSRDFYSAEDLSSHLCTVHKSDMDAAVDLNADTVIFELHGQSADVIQESKTLTKEISQTEKGQNQRFKSLLSTFTKF